jgi:hypothetical protein
MEAIFSRHKTGKAMLDMLNKYAPAFGMIGTLLDSSSCWETWTILPPLVPVWPSPC